MNASIEIQLVTTSPMNISAPEKNLAYNIKTGKLFNGPTGNGSFPVTPTRKMTLAETRSDDSQGRVTIPIIPANTLRGGLRRQIAQIYFDHIESNLNAKLSLDAHHVLTCGAANGRPDNYTSISDIQRYLADMYFGLIGGGPKIGATSQLKVRYGYPICPATVTADRTPLVSPKLLANIQATQTDWLTYAETQPRKDDASSASMSPSALIVKDLDKVVAEFENAAKSGKAENTDEEKGFRGLNGLSFIEAIPAKTPFFLRFDVINGQENSIGLLLQGLQRLFQKPIGGKSSIGFGYYAITDLAMKIDDEICIPDSVAPETWDQWFAQEGIVGRCVQAAKDELARIDIAELEDMCCPASSGVKEKPKKTAKAKK